MAKTYVNQVNRGVVALVLAWAAPRVLVAQGDIPVGAGGTNEETPTAANPALNPVQFEASPAGGAVVLVESGVPRATVVVPDGATAERNGVEMLAAREWIEHVELATGAKLAIVEESAAPAESHWVLIGDGALARRFGMAVGDLPLEGFRVRTFEADGRAGLMIAGRTPGPGEPQATNGTLFGVYDALERFVGVRWYYPGDDGRVVPALDTLTIPSVAYRDAPVFKKRTAWLATRGLDWRTMMFRHLDLLCSSKV